MAGETAKEGELADTEDETVITPDEKAGDAGTDGTEDDKGQVDGESIESDSGMDEEEEKKPPEAGEQPEEDNKPKEPPKPETSFNLKAEGKAEEINSQLIELKKKFDDGEIDFEEFLSKRDDLKAQLLKAEMYEDINKQVRQSAWESAKQAFVIQNPEIMNYASRAAGYTAILKDLIQSEQGQRMTDTEILEKAKEKFYEENPQLAPSPRNQEKIKKENPKSKVKDIKAEQKKKNIRTLANIPSADSNDTGESEFAHLDSLPPEQLEKALENMSDAERERYLEAP